jgi:SPP1 gp7 family putative phage head morphogenesis protein
MKSSVYNVKAREVLYGMLDNLAKKEKTEMLLLADKWGVVQTNLSELILKLAEKGVLTENQTFQSALYKEFLVEAKKQVNNYAKVAEEIITQGQFDFGKAGIEYTQSTIEMITPKFGRLSPDAVNNMIGVTKDGSPLYDILNKSYPDTVSKLTDTLIKSTALGRNPVETARLMKADMNGNLSRALTISRTEQMRVLRESSLMQMKESGVVKGWERIEQDDACEDCQEENGKQYALDEPFDTHPNCRGAMLPIVG